MTQLIRDLILANAENILATRISYTYRGRGNGSYDWIGMLMECVSNTTGKPVADETKDYLRDYTVMDAEELMFSWGLTLIPSKDAREGDILIMQSHGHVYGGVMAARCGHFENHDECQIIATSGALPVSRRWLRKAGRDAARVYRIS